MLFHIAVLTVIVIIASALVFIGGVGAVAYALPKSLAKFGGSSKVSGGGGTVSGSLSPSGWSILNSKNMPAMMGQNSSGYYFDFPTEDGVHAVCKPPVGLQAGQNIRMEFNVSGSGSVVPVQGAPPAKVSLFMQRKGDNLSAVGPYQQYRYYHSSAQLVNGDGLLEARLDPDQWTDVFGKRGTEFPAQFAACIADAAMIGFVLGDPGAGATAHGAYVRNGNARFTLKSFTNQA